METMTIVTAGSILIGGTAFALFTGWLCGRVEEQEHQEQLVDAPRQLPVREAAPAAPAAHAARRRGAA